MAISKRSIYSDLEKQVFLEILKKYKHVIESKGTNSSTLKEKSEAWSFITEEYNNSSLICTKRDVQQLKKYWSNLKQQSKNILTAERQSRFLTGGGPPKNISEVDPNVMDIIPTLMTTAPTVASSNFCTQDSADRQRKILKAIQKNSMTNIDSIINEEHSKKQENSSIASSSTESTFYTTGEEVNNMEIALDIDDSISVEKGYSSQSSDIIIVEKENEATLDFKRSKRIDANIYSNPKKPKTDRITLICKKEIELADIKISHEVEMCELKKKREELISEITIKKLLLEEKELQERYKLTKFRAQKEMGEHYVSDGD